MKKTRVLSLLLSAALCLSLAACAGGKKGDAPDPAALADAYAQAITGARDLEYNEAYPVLTSADQADAQEREMYFATLGVEPADVQAYAMSVSLMNVQAYAIVAMLPADGAADAVRAGLEGYVENQKNGFEHYLEDQYQVASSAKLETLDDGTILLVMCPDQDTVLDSIKSALAG